MTEKTEKPNNSNWGCFVAVCIVFSFLPLIALLNMRAMQEKENCDRAERDADNISYALASYYSDPERTDVPSVETLKKLKDLSLNGVGYIFGSSPYDIIIITSSEPKRCGRGKYHVRRDMGKLWGEWVDEWSDDILNPNLE
jgi:hypothetical protein